MELCVTKSAARLILDQLPVDQKQSAFVRFVVKRQHMKNKVRVIPELVKSVGQPIAHANVDQVTFYVDFADEWFFSGQQVTVDCQDGKIDFLTKDGESLIHPKPDSDASTSASQEFEEMWC